MTASNAYLEATAYPGKKFDALWAISAGVLTVFAGVLFMKRGKFAEKYKGKAGSPLHYGFPLLLLAMKNLLLIGLAGVLLVDRLDSRDEQAFTFPARYWVDAIALGVSSFEFWYRSHNTKEDRYRNQKAWMACAFLVAAQIGFALCAQNGGASHSRIAVVAIPSIAFYGISVGFQFYVWVWPMIQRKQFGRDNIITEILLAANVLWSAAYVCAFALGPAFADLVSSYHTTIWFFVLDVVYAAHVTTSMFWGTHARILKEQEADAASDATGMNSSYTAMSATQSVLKSNA